VRLLSRPFHTWSQASSVASPHGLAWLPSAGRLAIAALVVMTCLAGCAPSGAPAAVSTATPAATPIATPVPAGVTVEEPPPTVFSVPIVVTVSDSQSPLATPDIPAGTEVAAAAPAQGTAGSTLPAQGKIAWHSKRDGTYQIWVMDDNGLNPHQFTGGAGQGTNSEPDWSPDGTEIAFVSDRDGTNALQIYVMNADGSKQHPLMPFHSSHNWSPAWSPDGSMLLFQTSRDDNGRFEIYLVAKDGTGVRNLTSNPANDSRPAWSPDGRQIAFISDRSGSRQVWAMGADGSDPRQLTFSSGDNDFPHWSPDGKEILFQSNREGGGNTGSYVMNADGSDVRRIGDLTGNKIRPVWAQGGRAILYASDRENSDWDIFIADLDGANARQLTQGGDVDRYPTWHR